MPGTFDYIKYDDKSVETQMGIKGIVETLEAQIIKTLPGGRGKALALTKLQELYMWAGIAIRDDQMERGPYEHQERRG